MALYSMSVDAIALAAATAKSIAELGTSASDRAKIVEWSVTFDGVTSSAVPVKVEVGIFSAAVTTATTFNTTNLVGRWEGSDGAASTTAKHTTSTEGAGTSGTTAATPLMIFRIPPTSGMVYQAPLGREMILPVSGFWRIRCTAAAIVNVTFGVVWEE